MKNLHSTGKIKIAFLLSALFAVAGFGLASESRADVSVTATLSDSTTGAGEPVDLTVEIKGATSGQVPRSIGVNGLTITFSGQQNRMEWVNGVITQSVSCDYTIQADKAGKFTIPAIAVTVNGANYSTKPLTLTVTAGTGGGGGSAAGSAPGAQTGNTYVFGELIAPRQTAYVGEAIPLEARFYFDPRARFGQVGAPDIKSDGFTIQKIAPPQQSQVEKNGRNYTLLIYKTAVTPAKTGKLTLGPAQLECEAQFPQQRTPHRPTGGMDDFFNDNMFNQMMAFSPPQVVAVKSDSIDFEVKPLPGAGQPADFAGAVGQFSLATEASPLKVNVGDPITLKLKVSGRWGNFDRVTARRPSWTRAAGALIRLPANLRRTTTWGSAARKHSRWP